MIVSLHWFHWSIILLMGVIPISLLLGKSPNPCISHSYFAPGWFGKSCVIFNSQANIGRIPKLVFGQPLSIIFHNNRGDEFRQIIQFLITQFPNKEILQKQLLTNDVVVNNSQDLAVEIFNHCFVLEDQWIDWNFNNGPKDPFQEFHGPIPYDMWRLISEKKGLHGGFHLLRDRYSILGGYYHEVTPL